MHLTKPVLPVNPQLASSSFCVRDKPVGARRKSRSSLNAETRWRRAPFCLDVKMGNYATFPRVRRSDAPRRPQPGRVPLLSCYSCLHRRERCYNAVWGGVRRLAREIHRLPKATRVHCCSKMVSEAAFGLLNRGLAIMTKPDKASSRQISTGEPTQTLALSGFLPSLRMFPFRETYCRRYRRYRSHGPALSHIVTLAACTFRISSC